MTAKLPDSAECRELLRQMMLIRRFEEEAGRQYQRAKAGGFLHLAIGEEATIVGTCAAMRADDYLIGTYRTHGHAIARGTEPERVMAELFGRVDGTSGGRGGSMHIFDAERRFMGGYGIVGGNLPLAAGLALSSQYKGEDSVTVCMFGDGASNTGNFGETMNLAALWRLPVVFLVENNLYGMGTSVERHSAQTDLSRKAEGYGVPGRRVDGMDVIAVRDAVAEHVSLAREKGRPTLIEAFTYRYRGHSAADPEVYREKEEVAQWRQRDPIETFTKRCIGADRLDQDTVSGLWEEVEQAVAASVEFANNSPEPELHTLYDNLYVVSPTMGWYALDERSPEPHRGEDEEEAPQAAHELARAGAAYADRERASGSASRPNPAESGDAATGTESRLGREPERVETVSSPAIDDEPDSSPHDDVPDGGVD